MGVIVNRIKVVSLLLVLIPKVCLNAQETIGVDSIKETAFMPCKDFDEFSMKGIPSSFPGNVLVKETPSEVTVKLSHFPDSTISYKRVQNCWYNHVVLDWEKRSRAIYKDGFDMPARIYDRLIFNDTIIEIRTSIIKDFISYDLYVKTRNKISCYSCDDWEGIQYNQQFLENQLQFIKDLLYIDSVDSFFVLRSEYTECKSSFYSLYISKDKNSVLIKRSLYKHSISIQFGLEDYYDLDYYSLIPDN